MEINLIELLENPYKIEHVTVIKADYEVFKKNEVFIHRILGRSAKGFFIEKSAYIIFEERPNVLVIIKKEYFNREDFYFKDIEIEISGKSEKKINNFFQILKDDIKHYKLGLLIVILIYIIVFCTSNTIIGIENLNNIFIDIISIFIGMLFVFATMFYGKDELDEEIKNGRAQELFLTDKYIFILAMLSLLFTIISNGIINYEIPNIGKILSVNEFIKQNYYYIYWIIKYGIPELLTLISIVLNYICYRSIIDYYLAKIKSQAINRQIKEIKNNILDKISK